MLEFVVELLFDYRHCSSFYKCQLLVWRAAIGTWHSSKLDSKLPVHESVKRDPWHSSWVNILWTIELPSRHLSLVPRTSMSSLSVPTLCYHWCQLNIHCTFTLSNLYTYHGCLSHTLRLWLSGHVSVKLSWSELWLIWLTSTIVSGKIIKQLTVWCRTELLDNFNWPMNLTSK